uniref:Uncharacterized protein n=1 Tax=Chromera velia CCMP2878 TaxID=1169474 RepID=A0A0G4HZY5_9ALVE|eukprot:Cvel_9820.t1-p1 / transcript=Cvel_9820.t1 / gene=Cvel_9820 / organism=Chromera_velia_CCMP2878 / gene_product=hypothetical protein / transcript_product=hypothetical protein / location=Cvel_scaffold576:67557-72518(-) / protein_length=908 / sequence_SO=supercontig / SO=protein_coding / is_pseudo=false
MKPGEMDRLGAVALLSGIIRDPVGLNLLALCDGSDLHSVFVLCKTLRLWVEQEQNVVNLQNLPCVMSPSPAPTAEGMWLRRARLFLYLNNAIKLGTTLQGLRDGSVGTSQLGTAAKIRNTHDEDPFFKRDQEVSFALFATLRGRRRCRAVLTNYNYRMLPDEMTDLMHCLLSRCDRLDTVRRVYEQCREAQGRKAVPLLQRCILGLETSLLRAAAVNTSDSVVLWAVQKPREAITSKVLQQSTSQERGTERLVKRRLLLSINRALVGALKVGLGVENFRPSDQQIPSPNSSQKALIVLLDTVKDWRHELVEHHNRDPTHDSRTALTSLRQIFCRTDRNYQQFLLSMMEGSAEWTSRLLPFLFDTDIPKSPLTEMQWRLLDGAAHRHFVPFLRQVNVLKEGFVWGPEPGANSTEEMTVWNRHIAQVFLEALQEESNRLHGQFLTVEFLLRTFTRYSAAAVTDILQARLDPLPAALQYGGCTVLCVAILLDTPDSVLRLLWEAGGGKLKKETILAGSSPFLCSKIFGTGEYCLDLCEDGSVEVSAEAREVAAAASLYTETTLNEAVVPPVDDQTPGLLWCPLLSVSHPQCAKRILSRFMEKRIDPHLRGPFRASSSSTPNPDPSRERALLDPSVVPDVDVPPLSPPDNNDLNEEENLNFWSRLWFWGFVERHIEHNERRVKRGRAQVEPATRWTDDPFGVSASSPVLPSQEACRRQWMTLMGSLQGLGFLNRVFLPRTLRDTIEINRGRDAGAQGSSAQVESFVVASSLMELSQEVERRLEVAEGGTGQGDRAMALVLTVVLDLVISERTQLEEGSVRHYGGGGGPGPDVIRRTLGSGGGPLPPLTEGDTMTSQVAASSGEVRVRGEAGGDSPGGSWLFESDSDGFEWDSASDHRGDMTGEGEGDEGDRD